MHVKDKYTWTQNLSSYCAEVASGIYRSSLLLITPTHSSIKHPNAMPEK